MKFTSIYLGNNKIELFNSILGKETVTVNDAVVSEKSSFFGTDHNFTIKEDGYDSNCVLTTGMGFNGVVIDLYKNGKPVIESSKFNSTKIFTIIVIIILFWVIVNNG